MAEFKKKKKKKNFYLLGKLSSEYFSQLVERNQNVSTQRSSCRLLWCSQSLNNPTITVHREAKPQLFLKLLWNRRRRSARVWLCNYPWPFHSCPVTTVPQPLNTSRVSQKAVGTFTSSILYSTDIQMATRGVV